MTLIRAVMPPDPEMIQVGDAIWQRPQCRGLVQGAVRPVGIGTAPVIDEPHRQIAWPADEAARAINLRCRVVYVGVVPGPEGPAGKETRVKGPEPK